MPVAMPIPLPGMTSVAPDTLASVSATGAAVVLPRLTVLRLHPAVEVNALVRTEHLFPHVSRFGIPHPPGRQADAPAWLLGHQAARCAPKGSTVSGRQCRMYCLYTLLNAVTACYQCPLHGPAGVCPRWSILTQPINWPLIQQHYDDMIKYATALRLGTAEAEAILRRFTRPELQHPTYRALME